MPFREIKQPVDFIRIKPNGSITICVTLYNRYFDGKKVKIFIDDENNKLGFKPSDEGYKISLVGRARTICCRPLSRIVTGEFYPEWSKKHQMLIVDYGNQNG